MASDKPEPDGFLAVIDAKIAALQQLRESYIAAASVGAFGQPGDVASYASAVGSAAGTSSAQAVSSGPVELPTGVFRGKGLADAIRLYLSIAKRKQVQKEIATALLEGGLASTASDFDSTLSATLHRLRKTGELLQFKDGWDLAESYPESLRQRMIDAKEPVAKSGAGKKKGKRRKKMKATKTAEKATEKSARDKSAPKANAQPAKTAKAAKGEAKTEAVA